MKNSIRQRKTVETHAGQVMIDSLLAKLENRIKEHEDISKTLEFFSELTSLSIKQIQGQVYSRFSFFCNLEDTLITEVCFIDAHKETGECERISRAYYVQAFVIVESFSDIPKRRDWVTPTCEMSSIIQVCMMVSNPFGEESSSRLGIV